jgi:SSS family solute:Na+ symporter
MALFAAMGIIGLMSVILFPDIDSNAALPHLIKHSLPPILKGIAISGLIATIMSSADSLLHVAGVSVVEDLILPFRANMIEKTKLKYVRFLTIIMALLALIISFSFKDIFSIIVFAFSFWAPTILVPFIFMLYGQTFEKKELIFGVILGLTMVFGWSFFLKEITGLSGFIPGTLSNLLFFIFCIIKKEFIHER